MDGSLQKLLCRDDLDCDLSSLPPVTWHESGLKKHLHDGWLYFTAHLVIYWLSRWVFLLVRYQKTHWPLTSGPFGVLVVHPPTRGSKAVKRLGYTLVSFSGKNPSRHVCRFPEVVSSRAPWLLVVVPLLLWHHSQWLVEGGRGGGGVTGLMQQHAAHTLWSIKA